MRRNLSSLLLLSLFAMPAVASAQEKAQSSEPAQPRLGQAAGEPLVHSAPPSVPFGISPATSRDNVLDFHGYLLLPMKVGLMNRENPGPDQADLALHAPPLVPSNVRKFYYTGVVPDPWIQMNFTYGNANVAGTVIIGAQSATDGSGFYNPVEQLGVTDAYVSINPGRMLKFPGQVTGSGGPKIVQTDKDGTVKKSAVKAAWFDVKVGAMTARYGAMGAFDAGRYGTPLMFRTNSVGLSARSGMQVGSSAFVVEGGWGGQVARPPRGMLADGWNDFSDQNVGASWVSQLHAGFVQSDVLHLGVHYATAWSQDDQQVNSLIPNGRITVLGGDLRLTAGRFGHLYGGVAQTVATNSSSVSGVIEVLNARGGPELVKEYLGPNSGGDGSLTTFGGQYDLSVVRAIYDTKFEGKSPDLLLSGFAIGTNVKSDDANYDGIMKLKAGGQATYNIASWISVGGRFDHVRQNMDEGNTAFNIVSPRLMFHTDWQSRDEIALQYSHFMYGNEVVVQRGYPLQDDPEVPPDRNVFVLSGTFWW